LLLLLWLLLVLVGVRHRGELAPVCDANRLSLVFFPRNNQRREKHANSNLNVANSVNVFGMSIRACLE